MDDNQTPLRAEFPLGPHMIVVRQPSEGQILALMLSKKPADGDIAAGVAVTSRLVRVVERLVSPDEWESKVFGGLIDETIRHTDFLAFARDILQFDWKAADDARAKITELARQNDLLPQEATPEPAPRAEEDEWAEADRLLRAAEQTRRELHEHTAEPRAPRLLP